MPRSEKKYEFSPVEKQHQDSGKKMLRMFCGPTVLLLLTGAPYSDIKAGVNRFRNKRGMKVYKTTRKRGSTTRVNRSLAYHVQGMWHSEMSFMLKKYRMKPHLKKCTGMTLATFCEDMKFIKRNLVVCAGNHYLIYSDGKIYDTYQTEGAPATEHPFAKTRMECYWEISHDTPLHVQHALNVRYRIETEPGLEAASIDELRENFEQQAAETVAEDEAKTKRTNELQRKRYEKAKRLLAQWEKKQRIAKGRIKKYSDKVKYYQRKGMENATDKS